MQSLRTRVTSWLRRKPLEMATSHPVEDAPNDDGWTPPAGGHDYDPAQVQEQYTDGLTAWRKNPMAWRVISITTDYVVGDGIRLLSAAHLQRFIQGFWNHPLNRMDVRLPAMADELARSGDLFILLFRNPADGMSYLRLVTKDCIQQVETAENDWEQEIVYLEQVPGGLAPRRWLLPITPLAPRRRR